MAYVARLSGPERQRSLPNVGFVSCEIKKNVPVNASPCFANQFSLLANYVQDRSLHVGC